MTTKQPKLGHRVRDVITGVVGIATTERLLMSGTLQLGIQTSATEEHVKTGAYPDAFNIDVLQLEYVDDGLIERVIAPQDTGIEIGNRVKDEVTGQVGMVTSRVTFMNGCVYYDFQPDTPSSGPKRDVVPDMLFLDWHRLKVTGVGLAKKVAKQIEPTASGEKKPGGPVTKAQRAC